MLTYADIIEPSGQVLYRAWGGGGEGVKRGRAWGNVHKKLSTMHYTELKSFPLFHRLDPQHNQHNRPPHAPSCAERRPLEKGWVYSVREKIPLIVPLSTNTWPLNNFVFSSYWVNHYFFKHPFLYSKPRLWKALQLPSLNVQRVNVYNIF